MAVLALQWRHSGASMVRLIYWRRCGASAALLHASNVKARIGKTGVSGKYHFIGLHRFSVGDSLNETQS